MPNQPVETRSNKFIIIAIPTIIFLLVLIGLGIWLLMSEPNSNFLTQLLGTKPKQTNQVTQKKEIFPEATAHPNQSKIDRETTPVIKPIGTGKKSFRVVGGETDTPKLKPSILDPIDPKQGSSQKIIVNAENSEPIQSVLVKVKTDNKETPVIMKLTKGTTTDGTWEGNWTVNDTYQYTYSVDITAVAKNGEQSVTLTLR
jgi:hypothetical protein